MVTLVKASPDDIITELESVANFVSKIFDDEPIMYYQHVPKQPEEGSISVIFQNATVEQETALTYVDIREWQIIVFGKKDTEIAADPGVLRAMESIKKATIGAARQVIPLNDGSLRYMRIVNNGFSYGMPVKTEDGRWASVGILQTEVRRARDFETYKKIMEAGVRIN
mgnify:FL=1